MSGLLSVEHPPRDPRPTPSPAQTPPSKAASPKASATPRPLFDHQVPAVTDAVGGLAHTARGQVIMACGTGKTVVAQRIAETLAGTDTDTVLVLFPNLGLLAQNAQAWAAYREVEFTALALCSEQQVGRGRARDSDEIQLDTTEFGIPSTTDPEVLADWLRSTPGRRVVFATYQSSDKLAAMHTAHPELGGWSMIVCDEAHRTAGPGWSATGLFATVLDDTRVPAQRRLFLTATPRLHRLARGKAAKDLVSMDDDALFGPRLHELSFAAAAEKGVLARYRLVIIGVDDAAISTLIRSNSRLTGLHDLDARKAATLVAVNRAAKQYGLHRILAYHNTIQHSREFAEHLTLVESVLPHEHKPVGPLEVRHVDGAMPPVRRREALEALTDTDDTGGAWTVVSNVKCLAEGVDVPTLDGIVVCEPRSSAVDVVQMVGRAIRPNTTRDEPSVILLPVYLAPGEDPAQVVARSDFSGVVQTMTAMRDMDQTLDAHFADAAEPWEVTYQKVAAHTEVSGSLPSPDDNDPETARLGRWCVRQAVAVEEDIAVEPGRRRLTGPQTTKVTALPGFAEIDTTDVDWTGRKSRKSAGRPPIDFDFPDGVGEDVAAQLAEAIHLHVVGALTDGYETGVAHLRSYIAREGHANVPLRSVTDDGFKLGIWMNTRRYDRTIGRLSTARIDELSALGMVWSSSRDAGYRIGVDHLRSYIAAQSRANVPVTHVADDGFRLGTWVSHRREERRTETLSTKRIDELSALGMAWSSSRDAGYRIGVDHLRSYIAAQGNATVPQEFVTDDGFALGNWVRSRRKDRTIGRLTTTRIAELNALEMVWDTYEARYRSGVDHLRAYTAREGHARVPDSHVTDDGFTLGTWVRARRREHKKGTLSTARIAELNALGMMWSQGVV